MLEKLNPEQEEIMLQVRDKWLDLAFNKNQDGINKTLFEDGIKWLYNDLLEKPMPKIIYCESWLSCLLVIEILKNKDSVGDSINEIFWRSVGESVIRNIWRSVGRNVWESVGESVGRNVWRSVGESFMDSIRDSVGDSVLRNVSRSVGESFKEYSDYNGWNNFGWVSFYDFFDQINVLDDFKFKQYKKLIQSNCFNAYEYENYVFAIQPPIYINRNSKGVLHCTTKAAVEFKDGSCYYFINGRNIPENIFNKSNSLTKEDFIKEKNSDYKAAWYEILGQSKIMELLGAREVSIETIYHKNGDIETVSLLKTYDSFEEIDNQPFAWVKIVCPSTGTQYLQGVEPHHTTALSALSSLSPFNPSEYSFNFRS